MQVSPPTRWSSLLHRAVLIFVYAATSAMVFDNSARAVASLEDVGRRVPLVIWFGFAGALALGLASVTILGSVRIGTMLGSIGCALQIPSLLRTISDLVISHLPVIGYQIHYSRSTLWAELMIVVALIATAWTMFSNRKCLLATGH